MVYWSVQHSCIAQQPELLDLPFVNDKLSCSVMFTTQLTLSENLKDGVNLLKIAHGRSIF